MNIGDRIKKMRKKNKLTQIDLGKKINKSAQVISNWERDYTDPNHEDVFSLSKALVCSADYLLGRTDNPAPVEETDPFDNFEFLPGENLFFKDYNNLSYEDKLAVVKQIKALRKIAEEEHLKKQKEIEEHK